MSKLITGLIVICKVTKRESLGLDRVKTFTEISDI